MEGQGEEPVLPERLRLIHERAIRAAQSFRTAESLLVESLIEVEGQRVFARLGYSSLFTYATRALGLSEAVAYNAIAVARKARVVPQLRRQIHEGTISISRARKLVSVITPENQSFWLEKAASMTAYRLEKAVAEANPRELTPEKASFVSQSRLRLTLGVSEELMLDFRRAQDLVSRSKGLSVSLEATLSELVRIYLARKDPVLRSSRVVARKGFGHKSSSALANRTVPVDSRFTRTVNRLNESGVGIDPRKTARRTAIPAQVFHKVMIRDQGKCQFQNFDGVVCGEDRWIDLHHILPVSRGGENKPENLITLCRVHHRETHRATD